MKRTKSFVLALLLVLSFALPYYVIADITNNQDEGYISYEVPVFETPDGNDYDITAINSSESISVASTDRILGEFETIIINELGEEEVVIDVLEMQKARRGEEFVRIYSAARAAFMEFESSFLNKSKQPEFYGDAHFDEYGYLVLSIVSGYLNVIEKDAKYSDFAHFIQKHKEFIILREVRFSFEDLYNAQNYLNRYFRENPMHQITGWGINTIENSVIIYFDNPDMFTDIDKASLISDVNDSLIRDQRSSKYIFDPDMFTFEHRPFFTVEIFNPIFNDTSSYIPPDTPDTSIDSYNISNNVISINPGQAVSCGTTGFNTSIGFRVRRFIDHSPGFTASGHGFPIELAIARTNGLNFGTVLRTSQHDLDAAFIGSGSPGYLISASNRLNGTSFYHNDASAGPMKGDDLMAVGRTSGVMNGIVALNNQSIVCSAGFMVNNVAFVHFTPQPADSGGPVIYLSKSHNNMGTPSAIIHGRVTSHIGNYGIIMPMHRIINWFHVYPY